ncbi:hypothetical protein J6590_064015 [Homalodisca vitripennis]|nr:hypothetical protein J6590_064015 [Homalodisca vitripennis]
MFQDWLRSLSVCLALVQTAVSQPHNQLYRGKVGLCVSQDWLRSLSVCLALVQTAVSQPHNQLYRGKVGFCVSQDWLKSLSVCLALVQTAVSQPHNQLYRGKVGLCVSQDWLKSLSVCLALVQTAVSQPHNQLYRGKMGLCVSQDWLKSLSVCLALVQTAVSQPPNQLYRGKVGLCVSQVIKVLTLFRSLLCSPPCRQTVWYLSERLRWCVSELRRVLSGAGTEQDRDGAGSVSFLRQVDHALQQLNHSDLEGWKQIVDDMVCQAISVAKIASSIDYNEITSVCHRLLDESNQLACESDQRQVTLLKDSLAACLSSLEQRVNIAVLRLFLQVFSEPNGPVKRLVHCCGQALHTQRRTDLDSLVAELDAHIERIILVGQFAVSCCEDKGTRRASQMGEFDNEIERWGEVDVPYLPSQLICSSEVAAMRCCMASLESVDNYLVPAITAFYLTPDCVNKRAFVKFLCDHWQHQLTSLQSHLDSIIDSYAFSQVVQDSMEVLSKDLKGESDAVLEASQVIVRHGWLLYKHLSRSSDVSVASDVLDELKKALHKCEVAVTKQAHTSTITRQTKLILDSVDHICDQLSVSTASCAAVDGSCTGSPTNTPSIALSKMSIVFRV